MATYSGFTVCDADIAMHSIAARNSQFILISKSEITTRVTVQSHTVSKLNRTKKMDINYTTSHDCVVTE